MTRKQFFKAGATVVLTLATLAIIWASGMYGRVADVLVGVITLGGVCYWKRTPILAWVDGLLKENPFAAAGFTIVPLFLAALVGAVVVDHHKAQAFFDALYVGGVADVCLILFLADRWMKVHQTAAEKKAS